MERRFGRVDVSFAELRQELNNLHTDFVRIEQVFGARIESVAVVERVARLEERLAARP